MIFYYHPWRDGGYVTVSKREELPEGDFEITEFKWNRTVLWFLDDDNFTDDERQAAYEASKLKGGSEAEHCPHGNEFGECYTCTMASEQRIVDKSRPKSILDEE